MLYRIKQLAKSPRLTLSVVFYPIISIVKDNLDVYALHIIQQV